MNKHEKGQQNRKAVRAALRKKPASVTDIASRAEVPYVVAYRHLRALNDKGAAFKDSAGLYGRT